MIMKGIDAIKFVTEEFGIKSRYELAQSLTDENLKVQIIQISNYMSGKHKMSKKVAQRFHDVYGITISDCYDHSDFAETLKALDSDEV